MPFGGAGRGQKRPGRSPGPAHCRRAGNAQLKGQAGAGRGDFEERFKNLLEELYRDRSTILFIDEIHRLHPAIEEYLYPAMEDFRLDIIIDQGPNARSIQLNLPKFTLVGATTRAGMLTSPLRSRFGLVNRLDYYTREELCAIIERSAGLLNVPGGRPADRAALPRHAPRGQFPAALGAGLRPGARRRRDYGAVGARRPDHD